MSTIVLVLDGFGIGAMPDAGGLRPGDTAADTLASVLRWTRSHRTRELTVPYLAGLGLGRLRPELELSGRSLPEPTAARRSALGYPGADTFAGHQTMMGADMSHVELCRLAERIGPVRRALEAAGHRTRLLDDHPVIVVDDSMLVHDNLEADPGLNWNVSARLEEVSWQHILGAAHTVRRVAPVARVIAVGGHSDISLARAVRTGDGGTVGLDTPASGFYRNGGLRVQHLGADIDYHRQLPELAANHGIPVTLVGKAADILRSDRHVRYVPGVDTTELLRQTVEAAREPGLVVTNIQETDLAGHQQDSAKFAELLEDVDASLPSLLSCLHGSDRLVILADHGNDPQIGHGYHTREYVPVLVAAPDQSPEPQEAAPAVLGADLRSLADVGASLAQHLGAPAVGHGTPVDLMAQAGTVA